MDPWILVPVSKWIFMGNWDKFWRILGGKLTLKNIFSTRIMKKKGKKGSFNNLSPSTNTKIVSIIFQNVLGELSQIFFHNKFRLSISSKSSLKSEWIWFLPKVIRKWDTFKDFFLRIQKKLEKKNFWAYTHRHTKNTHLYNNLFFSSRNTFKLYFTCHVRFDFLAYRKNSWSWDIMFQWA